MVNRSGFNESLTICSFCYEIILVKGDGSFQGMESKDKRNFVCIPCIKILYVRLKKEVNCVD